MKISGLIETLKSQYRQPPERRRPIFAQSPPGAGKSDAFKTAASDLAAEHGLPFMDLTDRPARNTADAFCYLPLQATIEDPITLSGLPARALSENGRALDRAVFLPFGDKLPIAGRGLLEVQEINTAPPAVQAGLYDLFLHGKLGSYNLPAGWHVGATGNRDQDRAATQRIPMPLIGRWTRVEVEIDLGDWTKWALVNGVRTEVIAFFQFKPDLFHTFDASKQEAYCCPRTAVFASQIIDSAPAGLEHELLCGTIGEGVATELTAFMRIFREMVSVDQILLNPRSAPVPNDPAAACAIAAALAQKSTAGNFDRVLAYARRMLKEYEVLLVHLATGRDPQLNATRAFIEWASENSDVVLG